VYHRWVPTKSFESEVQKVARGKQPGIYETDGGTQYRYNVDKDYFAETSRGWADGAAIKPRLPRGFKPRHVTGLNATTGRRATAVVATVAAGLWTGGATTFSIEASDQADETQTVVSTINERPSLP
jgi:hypothetical protein